MDLKMVNLAIGKLSDDLENLKEQFKEMMSQIAVLKMKKMEMESPQIPLHGIEAEFITMQRVREILKMSRNSVLQLIRSGLIRQVRLTKRTIRYVKSEVLTLVNS